MDWFSVVFHAKFTPGEWPPFMAMNLLILVPPHRITIDGMRLGLANKKEKISRAHHPLSAIISVIERLVSVPKHVV